MLGLRDSEAFLPELVESIDGLLLDPGSLEVVAVDAGSSDGTLSILRRWSDRSPWAIRILDHPEAGGRSARSHGLEAAVGEWVLFLERDFLLDRGALGAANALLERHPEVALAALP